LVRPETVQFVVLVAEQVNEPGDEVTVYPAIVEPPLEAGVVQDTTELALA
jgi:hypothetical protein